MSILFVRGDARRLPLADRSIDLVFGSPPYEDARSYGIGFALRGQAWVDWMVGCVMEGLRVCRGLVAFVAGHGRTKNYRWSAVTSLLEADLHRAGVCLRNPPAFFRYGLPGSAGPDWLRADHERIICATDGGRLPWSDNTACGHPPKYGPGGAMSNRLTDGTRRNQWGGSATSGTNRRTHGGRQKPGRPSHRMTMTRERDGVHAQTTPYTPPVLANPGNVIRCVVGGNQMGDAAAHDNEAPFPLPLAEFFIRSFCPPGGVVVDPFSGSGTVAHAAHVHGRRAIAIDIRHDQCVIGGARLAAVASAQTRKRASAQASSTSEEPCPRQQRQQ